MPLLTIELHTINLGRRLLMFRAPRYPSLRGAKLLLGPLEVTLAGKARGA